MAKAASVTVALSVQGDGLVASDSDTFANAAAIAPTSVQLGVGNNIITLPAGTLRVKIKPLPGNAVVMILKGIAGDTGVQLAPSEPSYLSFAAGTTTFILATGGAATVLLFWC